MHLNALDEFYFTTIFKFYGSSLSLQDYKYLYALRVKSHHTLPPPKFQYPSTTLDTCSSLPIFTPNLEASIL